MVVLHQTVNDQAVALESSLPRENSMPVEGMSLELKRKRPSFAHVLEFRTSSTSRDICKESVGSTTV
jgi:hypothetical protein